MTNKLQGSFILKGNVIFPNHNHTITYQEHSFAICQDGISRGVYSSIPPEYQHLTIKDYGNCLIIPGMTDLHVHAPQYPFRGLGMDLELLEWLSVNTFPEESKYSDLSYARHSYEIFVKNLLLTTTTRACIFATIHNEATLVLMDLLEDSGLSTYVGRVNMDRNGGPSLCEVDAHTSYTETKDWILQSLNRYHHTKPILTPRFIPSCSDELMQHLCSLQTEFQLPLQSHLSENKEEIQWVKELVPSSSCYGDAYLSFGLFGGNVPTIMAHCIYSTPEEIVLLKEHHVYVAHCPESNMNITSGIAPIRHYMDLDLLVGLGTDVAGGSSLSLLKAMVSAIQSSKLYFRLVDSTKKPLTFEDVFYLATLGGGQFFGNVGSFLPDFAFDAVVLDDQSIQSPRTVTLAERMERLIYLSDHAKVIGKFVNGTQLY